MQKTPEFRLAVPYAAFVGVALVVPAFAHYRQEADPEAGGVAGAEWDLRFVESELALVGANLAYVERRNARSPGYYASDFVEELRLRERWYMTWRQQLVQGQSDFVKLDILKAEGDVILTKMRLSQDQQVRDALPDAVSDAQIKRRELAVESARVWLARVSDDSYAALSPDQRNRWRITLQRKDTMDRRIERRR